MPTIDELIAQATAGSIEPEQSEPLASSQERSSIDDLISRAEGGIGFADDSAVSKASVLETARGAFNMSPIAGVEELEGAVHAQQEQSIDDLIKLADEHNVRLETVEPGIGTKALHAAGRILMVGTNIGAGLIKHQEDSIKQIIYGDDWKERALGWVNTIGFNLNPASVKAQIEAVHRNETFKDTELFNVIKQAWSFEDDANYLYPQRAMKGAKVLDGVLEFVGDALIDPLTYVTVGASGAAKLSLTEGLNIGRVSLTKKGAKYLKQDLDAMVPLLVKENGLTEVAARQFVKDQWAAQSLRLIAEKTGQSPSIIEKSLVEIATDKNAPHIADAIIKSKASDLEAFWDLAGRLSDDELKLIERVISDGADAKITKHINSSLKVLESQHLGRTGKKLSKRSKLREKRRMKAALAFEKAAAGGNAGLSDWGSLVKFKGQAFSQLDTVLKKHPEMINELLDLGGIKFLGAEAVSRHALQNAGKALLELPVLGSGLRMAGQSRPAQWLGKAFRYDFGLPKLLSFIKTSDYLAPLHSAKLQIMRNATELFAGVTEAEARLITGALEPTFKLGKDGKPIALLKTSEAKIAELPDNIRDIAIRTKEIFREIAEKEVEVGILTEDQLIKDYVTHLIKLPEGVHPGSDAYGRIFRQVKRLSAKTRFSQGRTMPSIQILEEAYKAGKLDHPPITDIREIFLVRNLASAQAIVEKKFGDVVIDNFALKSFNAGGDTAKYDPKVYAEFEFGTKVAVVEKAIAENLSAMRKAAFNGLFSDDAMKAVTGLLAGTQRIHKFLLTVPFPTFTFRNMVTNVFNNAVAIGFNALNPRLALHAMAIQLSGKLSRAEVLSEFVAKTEWGKKLKFEGKYITTQLGDRFSYKDIRQLFEDTGLSTSTFVGAELSSKKAAKELAMENLSKSTSRKVAEELGIAKPMEKGLFLDLARGADAHAKVMNFLYHLEKGFSPKDAAAQVRKFLFDYSQITEFERGFLRKYVFPFYTYTRKNIGLHAATLIEKPGVFANTKKAFDQLHKRYNDEIVPEHLRGMPFIGWENEAGDNVFVSNYGMPYEDIAALINGDTRRIVEKLVSRGNFLAKFGIEMFTMYDTFRGERIEKVRSPEGLAKMLDTLPDKTKRRLGYKKKINALTGETEVRLKPEVMVFLRSMPTSRILSGFVEPVFMGDIKEDVKGLPATDPLAIKAAHQRVTRFQKRITTLVPMKIENINPDMQRRITWMENIRKLEEQLYEEGILNKYEVFSSEEDLDEALRVR